MGAGHAREFARHRLDANPAAWAYGIVSRLFCSHRCTRRCTTPPFAAAGSIAVSVACGWILVLSRRGSSARSTSSTTAARRTRSATPSSPSAPLRSWRQYLWRVSGAQYWSRQVRVIGRTCGGAGDGALRLPRSERGVGSFARCAIVPRELRRGRRGLGRDRLHLAALVPWRVVPVLLGQPMLRLYLLAEHTGCPMSPDMLENSRTVHRNPVVRLARPRTCPTTSRTASSSRSRPTRRFQGSRSSTPSSPDCGASPRVIRNQPCQDRVGMANRDLARRLGERAFRARAARRGSQEEGERRCAVHRGHGMPRLRFRNRLDVEKPELDQVWRCGCTDAHRQHARSQDGISHASSSKTAANGEPFIIGTRHGKPVVKVIRAAFDAPDPGASYAVLVRFLTGEDLGSRTTSTAWEPPRSRRSSSSDE